MLFVEVQRSSRAVHFGKFLINRLQLPRVLLRSKASFLYNTCELLSEQNGREYAEGVKHSVKLAFCIFTCARTCICAFFGPSCLNLGRTRDKVS
jgi:hypothetical protein